MTPGKEGLNISAVGFLVLLALTLLLIAPSSAARGFARSDDDCPNDWVLEGRNSYVPAGAPSISSISSPRGDVFDGYGEIGDLMGINGSNLASATSVRFGSTQACFGTGDGNDFLYVQVPAGGLHGQRTLVRVYNSLGVSNGFPFIYISDLGPSISSIEPTSGREGTIVTIRGWNFTDDSSVRFQRDNGRSRVASSVGVVSLKEIFARVPEGWDDVAKVNVRVRTPYGTSLDTEYDDFTYLSAGPPAVQTASALRPTPVVRLGEEEDTNTRFRPEAPPDSTEAELEVGPPAVQTARALPERPGRPRPFSTPTTTLLRPRPELEDVEPEPTPERPRPQIPLRPRLPRE